MPNPFATATEPALPKDTKNYLCQCCFILPVRLAISPTERLQPICTRCTSHWERPSQTRAAHQLIVGEYMRERDVQVRELLERTRKAEEITAVAQAGLKELEAFVAGEYEDHPIGDMHAAVESAIINDALGKRDSAYRARNRIFVDLWKLDELHRDADGLYCVCKKKLKDCEEYQILLPIGKEYYHWENHQIELMKQNKWHGLSYDHPESRQWRRTSPGWDWRGGRE